MSFKYAGGATWNSIRRFVSASVRNITGVDSGTEQEDNKPAHQHGLNNTEEQTDDIQDFVHSSGAKTAPRHTSRSRQRVPLSAIFQKDDFAPVSSSSNGIKVAASPPPSESSSSAPTSGKQIKKSPSSPAITLNPNSRPPLPVEKTASQGGESGAAGRFNIGHAERMGRRREMQDVTVLLPTLLSRGESVYSYFAVFDGHGGCMAADLAGRLLHEILLPKLGRLPPAKSLRDTYLEVNSLIRDQGIEDGTCALVALFVDSVVYIANAGDSEAVLFRNRKPRIMCSAHRPKLPEESARIRESGGFVTARGRVNGILAVSRALGDIPLQPFVTPEPEVTETHLTTDDEFLILACDGVWDVLSKEQACEVVASEPNAEKAAVLLRDKAYSSGSGDNISVVTIQLLRHGFRTLNLASSNS